MFSHCKIQCRVECEMVNPSKFLSSFNVDTWSWVKIQVRQSVFHFPIEKSKFFVIFSLSEVLWKLNDLQPKTDLVLLQFESKSLEEREIIFCSFRKASENENPNQNNLKSNQIDRNLLIFRVIIFGFVTFIQFQIGFLGKCLVFGVVFF